MRSEARTPAEYVAALPPEREVAIKKLRHVIRKNLPQGFKETMEYGMLAYVVPHSIFPAGYHCDSSRPLPFINLASQKQYVSLYHMGLHDGPLLEWLKGEWPKRTAMKLDMGRCCVRFRNLDQIPYEFIGELAAKMAPTEWIAAYESAIRKNAGSARSAASRARRPKPRKTGGS